MMTNHQGNKSIISRMAAYQLTMLAELKLQESRPLARKCVLMIGSDPRCEWRTDNPNLMPQHLLVTENKGTFFLTSNYTGTFINQMAMTKGRAYQLRPGQTVIVGSCHLHFSQCEDANPETILPVARVPAIKPLFSNQKKTTKAACLFSVTDNSTSTMGPPLATYWPVSMLTLCFLLPLASCLLLLPTKNPLPIAQISQPPQRSLTIPIPSSKHSATQITPTKKTTGHDKQKPYGLAAPMQRPIHYEATIRAAARLYNLDPAFLKAVIHAESGFDPFAVSIAGAQGLMQIMPATAAELALDDPFHPSNNILSGSQLLRRLLDKYQQNVPLALAAYNAGEQAVQKYHGVPPYKETKEYIKKVKRLRVIYRTEQVAHVAANTMN